MNAKAAHLVRRHGGHTVLVRHLVISVEAQPVETLDFRPLVHGVPTPDRQLYAGIMVEHYLVDNDEK